MIKKQLTVKMSKDAINREISNERGWDADWHDDANWPMLLRDISDEIDLCKYGKSDWVAEVYGSPRPRKVAGCSIEEVVCLLWLKWRDNHCVL